jgi:hypothetical protein
MKSYESEPVFVSECIKDIELSKSEHLSNLDEITCKGKYM